MSTHRVGGGPRSGSGTKRTGRSTFKDSWLDGLDVNGDSPRRYVQKTSSFTFKCSWCKSSDLAVDNNGKQGLIQHFKSKKHRDTANFITGRNANQITFNIQHDDNDNNPNNLADDNYEDETAEVIEQEEVAEVIEKEVAASSESGRKGIKKNFKPVEKADTIPPTEIKMNLDNKAVRAEIMLAMKAVESDWSYSSLDDLCELLVDIAPDSAILKKMKMKSSKLSYVVSHGLGPHFHEILVKDLKTAPSFTLGLDSATTKQLGLSKSLDFKVRYFSERFGMVRFSLNLL